MKKAFDFGQEAINFLCDIQDEFIKLVDKKSDLSSYAKYNYPSDELKAEVKQVVTDDDMSKFFQ